MLSGPNVEDSNLARPQFAHFDPVKVDSEVTGSTDHSVRSVKPNCRTPDHVPRVPTLVAERRRTGGAPGYAKSRENTPYSAIGSSQSLPYRHPLIPP